MKVFHCDHCEQLVFFENTLCGRCGNLLAYLPDLEVVGSLSAIDATTWKSPLARAAGRTYRLCANYVVNQACNWAVSAEDANPFCRSCRLTQIIPDLRWPGNREAWQKLEAAKRRLVYSLLRLGCPVEAKSESSRGLAFRFLADDYVPVLTGHANGVITINIAEADEVERERRRLQLHEPYRTLLGHFRHESGHHYWDRLVAHTPRLEGFRDLFGDERDDYAEALHRNYRDGPPRDWQARHVSAYASCHPWEDWAETWAHYLHMADTLEMARTCGLSLRPTRPDEPSLSRLTLEADGFDALIDQWFPLTYLLNNLNRGLGQSDAYPFVLSSPAVEKLRFIHEVVHGWTPRNRQSRQDRSSLTPV